MEGLPGYDACVVNKTFLEPAPGPPDPGQLMRSQTAPPHFAPVPVTSISLYYDDPDAVASEKDPDDADDADDADDSDGPAPPPPAPAELERLKTGYRVFDEPPEHWQWDCRGARQGQGGAPSRVVQMVPVYAAPAAVLVQPAHAAASPSEQQGVAQDALSGAELPLAPPGEGGGPPMPQTLQRSTSVSTRAARIEWTVDARKLRGNDKSAVSPPFELTCGGRTLPFRMMIYPKQVNDQKGGASFKKSRGKGTVTVKCEADLTQLTTPLQFRIYVGAGANRQTPRGPVEHDFSASAVCTLPKDVEEWDFSEARDAVSSTFVVGLEVLMQ